MSVRILNREFRHPADGWYQIEVAGEHPNRAAGVVQVIDAEACESIVNRFNAEASSDEFPGMLIDHEHFKHDVNKESRAYGWLMKLQNRADGIYGFIQWTATGKKAVDDGDYRFFSSEYDPNDLRVLNRGEKPARVRPVRLSGLTVTNMPNNKGGKPITNREEFRRDVSASPAGKEKANTNQRTQMKSVATKLGLSADASEEAVLAEVTKIINRAAELEGQAGPLKNRVTELETANGALVADQVALDLDARGVKDEKVRNRLTPILTPMKNREERLAFLSDMGFAQATGGERGEVRVLNRADARTPESKATGDKGSEAAKLVRDYKIRNRCSFEDAWNAVRREKPELFE